MGNDHPKIEIHLEWWLRSCTQSTRLEGEGHGGDGAKEEMEKKEKRKEVEEDNKHIAE